MSIESPTIRPLGYSDLPQVIAIERRAFPTAWSLGMFVLELSKPSGICLAAIRDSKLVGYLICARYADVWHTGPQPEYAELSAQLDRECEAIGRNPASVERASSLSLSEDWDEIQANVDRLRNLGVSYAVCGWPGQGRQRIEEFASRLMPAYV